MPYIGNGKYQINNANTGEQATVTADQLPQYGIPASQVAQTATPDPNASPFANSPPMQINANGTPGGNPLNDAIEQGNPINTTIGSPNDLGISNTLTSSDAESFGTPQADPYQDNSNSNNGGDTSGGGSSLTDLIGGAASLLPLMGPEGLVAKMVLGGGLGLLTGIATGGNTQQDIFDAVGGAAGAGALTGLVHLIPSAIKIKAGSDFLAKALDGGEQALSSGALTPLPDMITKTFGEIGKPAEGIMPGVTGSDSANLLKTFNQELMTMPGAGDLDATTLHRMQEVKQAFAAKGDWDSPNPTPTEKFYRNMSGQAGKIVGYYAGKPYTAANNVLSYAYKDKALNQGFGQKLLNIGRGTMYAYYDTMGGIQFGKSLLNMGNPQSPNQQSSGPTLPINQSLVPGQ